MRARLQGSEGRGARHGFMLARKRLLRMPLPTPAGAGSALFRSLRAVEKCMTEDAAIETGQKIDRPVPAGDRSPAARRGRAVATGALASGALALGAAAVGALALGAIAVGAIAIGKLAVGELSLGRARLRRARVSELRIAKLTIGELRVERMPAPEAGSE